MDGVQGRHRSIGGAVNALLGAVLLDCIVSPVVLAQTDRCLADVMAAASGDVGYRFRGTRCEGTLRRYVSTATDIKLVGYHVGRPTLRVPGDKAASLVILASTVSEPVSLRATSLTSQFRYQMDSSAVVVGRAFHWPLDVVEQAATAGPGGKGLDLSTLGVVACNNRCSDRPDTMYWPVAFTVEAPSPTVRGSLVLRSGIRAEKLRLEISPVDTAKGTPRKWQVPNVTLTPDGVSSIDLPQGVETGLYRLVVDARDTETSQALGSLHAIIFVPPSGR